MKKIIFLLAWLHSSSCFGFDVYLNGSRPGFSNPTKQDSIAIHSAKGEFNLLLMVFNKTNSNEILEDLKVEISDGKNIQIKKYLGFVHQSKDKFSSAKNSIKEYLDILIPFEDVPFVKVPKKNKGQSSYVLIEYFTPPNTESKDYLSTIKFRKTKKKIKLKVYPVLIPRKLSFISTFGFAPWVVTLKHYGNWVKDNNKLFDNYFRLSSDHRIDLHKIYSSFGSKENPLNFPMDRYRKTYYETWKSLKSGIDSEYGFKGNSIDLPIPEASRSDSKFLKKMNEQILKFEMSEESYVYFVDEPSAKMIKKLPDEINLFKKKTPNSNILVTTDYHSELNGKVDWWVPNVIHLMDSPEKKIKKIKENSKKVLFYTSCNSHGCDKQLDSKLSDFVIDRPGGHVRSIPWLGHLYGLDGFLYYDTVRGYQEDGLSPWEDMFLFSGKGDGNLFYPCSKKLCGEKNELAFVSWRLKIYRDGLEDYELLDQAIKQGYPIKKVKRLFNDFKLKNTGINYYEEEKIKLLKFMQKRSSQ